MRGNRFLYILYRNDCKIITHQLNVIALDNSEIKNNPLVPIELTSGNLIGIDQYMLSNQVFKERLSAAKEPLSIVEDYGGIGINLSAGTYSVLRDVENRAVILATLTEDQGKNTDEITSLCEGLKSNESIGNLFIDTRCIVLCDADLLKNSSLLAEFTKLRLKGKDKPARDLLRENGAVVRYGFGRNGDKFEVYCQSDENAVAFIASRRTYKNRNRSSNAAASDN